LQAKLAAACEKAGVQWKMAQPALRTDNALMIAYAASHRVDRPSEISVDVRPNFDPVFLAVY
jgi:tRNA A37 threonylcarbamoyltransferase TsaD